MSEDSESQCDYIEIKAEIFKVVRANSDTKNPKRVMAAIKEHLPDVDDALIIQALTELCTN